MIFNCHTHIGDAFIELPQKKFSVYELVAPPDGLKHKMLEKASKTEILNGMKRAVRIMEGCGTDIFIDFREGGIEGIELLKEAIRDSKIKAIILARPKNMKYDEEEMEKLLDMSHGIGISSIADWNFEELEMIVNHVKDRKKIFAMHASEDKREDIDKILDLEPHFLVHLCKATEEDINEVAKKKIGVVVCPRANKFFGLKPPISLLLEKNVSVMLGTDNAMIVKPNIIEEMKFLVKNYGVEKNIAIKMISNTPLKIFGEILKNHVYS